MCSPLDFSAKLGPMDDALMDDYKAAIAQHLTATMPWLTGMKERERRDALTPEQREIEDLRRAVADLTGRLERAARALSGEDELDYLDD